MRQLKIGSYIRTGKGIAQIIGEDVNNFTLSSPLFGFFEDETLSTNLPKDYVEKTSKTLEASECILDLIREGDYINGEPIDVILELRGTGDMKRLDCGTSVFYEEDIISVVTRDLFNGVSFKKVKESIR